jgi:shikimate dehydrogenase
MNNQYAVMGNPIAHSLSPQIHTQFAAQFGLEICYEKRLVLIDEFEQAVRNFFNQGGLGLNVTLPFKNRAFELAGIVTKRAKGAKSANTLWIDECGDIHADSTDGIGLKRDLNKHCNINGKKILVIGASGAASAIIATLLEQKPATLHIANRTKQKASFIASLYDGVSSSGLSDINQSFDIIINATSCSLDGQIPPINSSVFAPGSLCYDMVYGEKAHVFLDWAKKNGAKFCVDGLGMLVEQAAESFYIWRGVKPKTNPVYRKLRDSL